MSLITSLLRPHHTNLNDPPNTLRGLLHYLDDQRSNTDRGTHHEAFTPVFDVREGPFAYFLEGEFPGVRDKGAISIEWSGHRSLVVRAVISHLELEAEWGEEIVGYDEHVADTEQMSHHRHHGEKSPKRIKSWIHERNLGEFERTFTFPTEIEPSGLRARLEQGLLKVLVPKKKEGEP